MPIRAHAARILAVLSGPFLLAYRVSRDTKARMNPLPPFSTRQVLPHQTHPPMGSESAQNKEPSRGYLTKGASLPLPERPSLHQGTSLPLEKCFPRGRSSSHVPDLAHEAVMFSARDSLRNPRHDTHQSRASRLLSEIQSPGKAWLSMMPS